MRGARRALAVVSAAIAIGAIPAVALAHFTSSPTAAITLSSGPLPPTGAAITKCTGGHKLTIAWTAPVGGMLPTSYTLWVSIDGVETYTHVEQTITGSQTSTEYTGLPGVNYRVALKAAYGTWTSALSTPSSSVAC